MNTKIDELYIETSGGKIYVKKWIPEGICFDTSIVLLHDSIGCVDLWRGFPELMSSMLSCCVIAYDRLGYGKSDARYALPSVEFIEEEAAAFVSIIKKSLSLKKYILCGYSVGGAMSISIASHDPDCEAVITIASQAFVEDRTIKSIRDAKHAFQKQGALRKLEKWHGKKAEWVLRAWTDVWLSPGFADWSLESYIGQVTCPVFAIHCDNDEYGSNAFPEFITGKVGGESKIQILQQCGHKPHREYPQTVIETVKQFLNQHRVLTYGQKNDQF